MHIVCLIFALIVIQVTEEIRFLETDKSILYKKPFLALANENSISYVFLAGTCVETEVYNYAFALLCCTLKWKNMFHLE